MFVGHAKLKIDLKLPAEFWKGFILFILFQLSASITVHSLIEACSKARSVLPRQYATFTGIFLWLYPETDPQQTAHCVGPMLNCLRGQSDLSDHWTRPLCYSVHHPDVFDSVTSSSDVTLWPVGTRSSRFSEVIPNMYQKPGVICIDLCFPDPGLLKAHMFSSNICFCLVMDTIPGHPFLDLGEREKSVTESNFMTWKDT